MLKCKNYNQELHPDTVLYEMKSFRVVEHCSGEECIYIRVSIDDKNASYIIIGNSGKYSLDTISTSDTIGSHLGYDCSVYKY